MHAPRIDALTAWPASHADITVSGGKAVLPVKSTYPAMKTNEDKYFDSVFAEIQLPTAAGNGTKQVLFDVVQQDSGDYAMFQRYTSLVNDNSSRIMTLRSLMDF